MVATLQTVEETSKLRGKGASILVDVRTPGEFSESHIEDSANIPLADLKRFEDELSRAASKKGLVLVCRTGKRATVAQEKLAKLGINSTRVLEGGIEAWKANGNETTEGQQSVSIERQVRIAAGALVVVGVVLGHFLHPGWNALAAFVGAGLMFAGITDTCGMALALGRLPYNRVRPGAKLLAALD